MPATERRQRQPRRDGLPAPSSEVVAAEALRTALLRWWDGGHRDLPWRQCTDPYAILVSEIMLQQTQAERVAPKWTAFIQQFPSVESVALASAAAVIGAWAGLGYNRRAVNLHRLCRVVVDRHGGLLPGSVTALEALPGVGAYTARAVAAIAFDQPAAAVDTNVRRVLLRLVDGDGTARTPAAIQQLADAMLAAERPGDWNQAVMELGALHCTATRPRCDGCPVAGLCQAAPSFRAVAESRSSYRTIRARAGAPAFQGSSRFYRGRIVALLREDGGSTPVAVDTLGRQLLPAYDERMRPWLETLLAGLERDGLVERAGTNELVRLPV